MKINEQLMRIRCYFIILEGNPVVPEIYLKLETNKIT